MINLLRLLLMSSVTVTLHIYPPKPTSTLDYVTCTGVYISPTEVLTAQHCFHTPNDNVTIIHSDQEETGKLGYYIVKNDLALVKIKNPKRHNYCGLGKNPAIGSSVYNLSTQEDLEGTYGEGYVRNYVISVLENRTPGILSSILIAPGASGSGLFDWYGNLVGINTVAMADASIAIDTLTIKHFIEDAEEHSKITNIL